jgi:hypothetical protein
MYEAKPHLRSIAGLISGVVLAACGGGASTGPVTGAGGGGAAGTAPAAAGGPAVPTGQVGAGVSAIADGTVAFTGPARVQGTFETAVAPLPCTTLAQTGTGGRFPVPSPGQVGHEQVDISLAAFPYTGPAQYGIERLRGAGMGVSIGGRRYALDGAATAVLSVRPDASGQLQLANLPATSGPPGPPLSGTVSWTCRSSQVGSGPSEQPSAQP